MNKNINIEILKTKHDLENLRNVKTNIFGNAYEFTMERLVDYYISKSDGIERIEHELTAWTIEAQKEILYEVCQRLEKMDADTDTLIKYFSFMEFV